MAVLRIAPVLAHVYYSYLDSQSCWEKEPNNTCGDVKNKPSCTCTALGHETVSANAEMYLVGVLSSLPHCYACNKT